MLVGGVFGNLTALAGPPEHHVPSLHGLVGVGNLPVNRLSVPVRATCLYLDAEGYFSSASSTISNSLSRTDSPGVRAEVSAMRHPLRDE